MRILFVTPYVPSRIRTRPFNVIKFLSTQHEIHLVSLLCDAYEKELVREVASYCTTVQLVPLTKLQAYTNCVRALPSSMPLRVAYYQSPHFIQSMRQMIHAHKIDIVHGELIKVVPALRAALAQEHIPCLYDSVDCISSYLEQQYHTVQNPLKKQFVYTELAKMRRYEKKILLAFDHTIVTSDHDRDCLMALEGRLRHIETIPNGVDTEYFVPGQAERTPDSLVFCAKLDYFPNAQAIQHFCQRVLPLIWKHRPQVRLTIVGNNPPPAIQNLSADERITVTGYVPDIRPYVSSIAVALAPLLVAAGMQNKVLEAMAMGTPVVATSQSCKALRVRDRSELMIADEPQAFACAVLEVLENAHLAQHLSQAGRQYVEQYHSWTAITKTLSKLYQEMILTRSRSLSLEMETSTV